MHRLLNILKKVVKYSLLLVLVLLLAVVATVAILYWSADMREPKVAIDISSYVVKDSADYRMCHAGTLHQNRSGLWELYLEGDAIERGVVFGKLAEPLLYFQEKAFVDQIKEIIPSETYLKFLRSLTVVFNRNLGEYINEEYRKEIYGLSQSCSNEFDYIGTPYERQLNFHAAHDIGHTMQEYMLVGCSAFGAWGSVSEDSELIIGRNFDFFVGDEFAKNKIVMFVNPDKGYKYASVSWAGMIGVLSGMNEAGLTVTINAAKGAMPTSSATPISILAREILQYASTIDEAYAIAEKRKTFVSESLLIGSAKDGVAAIIEKSPDKVGLFRSKTSYIISTNHYQSSVFENDPANIENIATSDSPYRYEKLKRMIAAKKPLSSVTVAEILRDRTGINGEDIGLTNEKSINQSIGHHSVIFKPKELLMWVSTSPWQSGEFVCYDLKEIFSGKNRYNGFDVKSMAIPADTVFLNHDFKNIVDYRHLSKSIRHSIKEQKTISTDTLKKFVATNPNFFATYDLLGDYYWKFGNKQAAAKEWRKALSLEIPRKSEVDAINKKIERLSK